MTHDHDRGLAGPGAVPRAAARPGFWGLFLAALLAAGAGILYVRYTRGLGAVTHLSDAFPWGLWIGFDVLCGVGLAAGGFVVTTLVYVFNARRFQPVVRPALLTAFLGYVLVVVALLFDLGRPWNLWRPIVLWNPRSVMFEVSWCVMLYTTVLALELAGLVCERLGWRRALALQQAATPPLVIAGALLSTLHQSSLGSFYLIMPGKLHPLWYTPLLPVIFWLSSVCAGLAMVVVESHLSARAFGRRLEPELTGEIGRVLAAALFFFGVVRLYDLARRGVLAQAWGATPEALLFQIEFALGVLLPMLLLARPAVRASARGLYAACLLAVMGFVTHRLNVSITGFESALGRTYVPAWTELVITLMLVGLGFYAFRLAVRHLPVFPAQAAPALEARP